MIRPGAASTSSRSRLVALSGVEPVARGLHRLVYPHPDNADLLIKIALPKRSPNLNFVQRRRRFRQLKSSAREVREFLSIHGSSPDYVHLVEYIHGFCDTDLGLGLIVEALKGEDGSLAPTLTTIIAQGRFDTVAEKELDRFLDELVASAIIVGDFSTSNLVYAFAPDMGTSHFVMIDGLGEKLFLPLNTMSLAFRRWNTRRLIARLKANMTTALARA